MTKTPIATVLLILCVFLSVAQASRAQNVISMPAQTVLNRGELMAIPVVGSLAEEGSAEVTISYPVDVMRVVAVVGGDGFLFRCWDVEIVENITVDNTTGRLVVRCENVGSGQNMPLFSLRVEGLNNPLRTGTIVPTSLLLNTVEQNNAEFNGGSVELSTNYGVKPAVAEGFVNNYPNPFTNRSTFVFTLIEAGEVTLNVRTLQGRIVREVGTFFANAGENSIDLVLENNELAQGAYVMQLITVNGQYSQSFMVLTQ